MLSWAYGFALFFMSVDEETVASEGFALTEMSPLCVKFCPI